MINVIRKVRIKFTPAQKLEYVKLMIKENYSNKQIIELSGVSSSAVVRWEKQYIAEKSGEIPTNKVALDPQLRRIQELEQQLVEAKEDNKILKKVDPTLCSQKICQLFNVPISSYYKQQEYVMSNPEENAIISRMRGIHDDNLHCFGRRRMLKALLKEDIKIGLFKVARLMKDAGIIAKIPKKPHYYPAGKEMPNIPNLLKR